MFNDLGSLLPQAIKRAGITRQVDSSNVVKVAEKKLKEKLPPEAAEDLKPVYIKDGLLAIAALSPVAAQELQFRENEVIDEINEKFGKQVVKRIKYLA